MPELHVLTDPLLARGRSHLQVVTAALAGGADVIQFRDKRVAPGSREAMARPLLEVVRCAEKTFVINDHLDLACALGADGLHLGPEDLPVGAARARWPRPSLLGASARTPERALEVVSQGADYLGVGPVFATRTKAGVPAAIGLSGLREVVAAVDVPVIGIGGIDAENAGEVIRAGAAGVAVIASVIGAGDVEAAARALRETLDRAATEPRGSSSVHHGGANRGPLLG